MATKATTPGVVGHAQIAEPAVTAVKDGCAGKASAAAAKNDSAESIARRLTRWLAQSGVVLAPFWRQDLNASKNGRIPATKRPQEGAKGAKLAARVGCSTPYEWF